MNRAAILLLLALVADVGAATFRVDDSGSVPLESSTLMRWRQVAPSRQTDNTMEGLVNVQVRLNLEPWLGRQARLFLVLPEQPLGPMRAAWTTQGRLLPGQLVAGRRALVYSGVITMPRLEEVLLLKLETDGTQLGNSHRVNFHFEIDVD
ncbi:MAG: hypothetical protein WBC37_03700 [Burkholderiaceae bacterium]